MPSTIDCRLPENRNWYFTQLYGLNLHYRIMPGLVYLYMPLLAQTYHWDDEQRLWFAFLNGMTQNPITSLRLFSQLPEVPTPGRSIAPFTDWFNANWETLQFDVDRRYQKRDTIQSIETYAALVAQFGSQYRMLTGKPFGDLWDLARNRYYSFGRLSAFSYLEYVYLNGYGADCDDLKFGDRDGSKSHRNGMMFLFGRDEMVWDRRMQNGFDGDYGDIGLLANRLQGLAEAWLAGFRKGNPHMTDVSQFTLESNLCTFKNHFFGHRYPGIYADMAWDRITWADSRGLQSFTEVFKAMRAAHLPAWLRAETETIPLTIKQKAASFPATGFPFRAEFFLN